MTRAHATPRFPAENYLNRELGLLAFEAVPGWQFYNSDSIFINLTYDNIRDMIRRDRNHPCIAWWETILNESVPPTSWKLGAIKAAKEEYPGDQCFTAGDQCFAKWKEQDDSYDISYNDFGSGYTRANNTKKPGFIREYYDYEFGGHYSTTRIRRGDGQAALLQNVWNAQWSHNRYRKQYPWTMGDAIFSMFQSIGADTFIADCSISRANCNHLRQARNEPNPFFNGITLDNKGLPTKHYCEG